ncbi:uncharacterized protein LOC142165994 [Nicotiana tabacum]|uniref:Uncharacterized protein LOC142165994 n=1 Tax=Nicotiana tabacum TaxID=4097 RepID=A0AC58S6A7_TOBAC
MAQEEKLLRVLRKHNRAIGWTMYDIRGISPAFYMHKILMEDGHKPSVEQKRHLNPIMKEVLTKEMVKWLDTGIVFLANGEKAIFMVREGIVRGHKVSKSGLQVNKAKVEAVEKLPPSTSVKGICSFLGHGGFYHHFIKGFPKFFSPLCMLLEKDTPFKFDDSYLKAFEELKGRLVTAPIIIAPDWAQQFELMCDASDIGIRAVLGDRKGTGNRVANHLSRLEDRNHVVEGGSIKETFPNEQLLSITSSEASWYILVAVDYVSKWVEAIALPSNDAKVVVNFVKKHIFPRFRTPRVLISDRVTHFCNKLLNNVLTKYGVKHKVATAYHPQMSGQVKVSNREVKQILEKTVSGNRKDWAEKAG